MGGIILEHIENMVEINEDVINGNNIYFIKLKTALVSRCSK